MKQEQLWKLFMESGSISAYLQYKRGENRNQGHDAL